MCFNAHTLQRLQATMSQDKTVPLETIPTEKTTRKMQLDEKIQQEQDFVSLIQNGLNRSNQLTNGLVSILSSFDSRLERLEDAIIPEHQQTVTLQRLKANVDTTLLLLDPVICHYQAVSDTDRIVAQGPTGRVEEYVARIKQITRAEAYFRQEDPDGAELKTLKVRFERGKELLQAEWQRLLLRHSRPVPPADILDLLDTQEVLGSRSSVENLPPAVLQDIICLSAWLLENNCYQDESRPVEEGAAPSAKRTWTLRADAKLKTQSLDRQPSLDSLGPMGPGNPLKMAANMLKTLSLDRDSSLQPLPGFSRARRQPVFNLLTVYSCVRSSELDHSIKNFKDHLRKSSASSWSKHCPSVHDQQRDSLTRKTSLKRPGKDFEIESFKRCADAFVALAKMEFSLLAKIFPEAHWETVYDSLLQEALANLIHDGQSVGYAVRGAIARQEYSAVFTILRVLHFLTDTNTSLDRAFQNTTESTKKKIPALIRALQTVASRALAEYANSLTHTADKESNMPRDGTVHQLTSNAVLFLCQMLREKETAEALFTPSESTSGSSSSSVSSKCDGSTLKPYICRVLENLVTTLQTKARWYEDPAQSAIFLLNNYNYILGSTQKSPLREEFADAGNELVVMCGKLIEQQTQIYQCSWLKVTEWLTDRNLPTIQQGDKLKEKERQIIKDKFKGFSDGLEELCKTLRVWTIPDQKQRDAVLQAQRSTVCPAYRAFLQRYGNVHFTKHPEKYCKYSLEQVEEMIDRLFDTSA